MCVVIVLNIGHSRLLEISYMWPENTGFNNIIIIIIGNALVICSSFLYLNFLTEFLKWKMNFHSLQEEQHFMKLGMIMWEEKNCLKLIN